MATASGKQSPPIKQPNLRHLLEETPQSVDFFQAVQLLERIYPDREPVGWFVHPAKEVARFTTNLSIGFPASQIHEIEWRDGAPPLLMVNFMGMTGPTGVLPHVYSMLLIERRWARDRTLHEFLDIFSHRMISFHYRAWRKYRVSAIYGSGERDRYTQYLKDFVGLGTKSLQNRQKIPDAPFVYYAGLLMMQQRSAIALEDLLADYFNAPVEVQQFAGGWYTLPEEAQCQMIDEETISRQLGFGAVAGDQIFDHQPRARIRIGPLSLKKYRDFLPDGRLHSALQALTRFYSGGQVDFEVQLVLARDEVPEYELGVDGDDALPLGLCSWAKTGPFDRDPDEAVLSLGEEQWA